MFWILTLLLVVIAASFVIIPLQRQQSVGQQIGIADRNAANLIIFKERLAELEHDLEEGLLEPAQFASLKAELEKNILADVAEDAETATAAPVANDWKNPVRLVPVAALVVVLPFSYLLYSMWGFHKDLEVAEIIERSRQVSDDPVAIRDMIFELGSVVEKDPENGWALYFIARHLVSLGQIPEAAMFFERAANFIDNPMDKAAVLGQYAQAQYIASNQQITEEVRDIINQAQRLNPGEPTILQLLGADAFVNQDYQAALTYWQRLLAMNPVGEEADFLRSIIAQAQEVLGANAGDMQTASGPRLEIALSLAPEVVLPGQTRVFISAQNTEAGGPPLAARVMTVAELPAVVTLSDDDAVGPFNLSSAEQVVIVATASLSGSADVQRGDYQVRSDALPLDDSSEAPVRLQLQIRDAVR